MSNLQEFQTQEFNEFIKNKSNGLIVFRAPRCAACKVITPILEKMAGNHKKLIFAKIDVSKSPGLASRMGVMSLPNILFFHQGKVADQLIGTASGKEIEKKLKKIV